MYTSMNRTCDCIRGEGNPYLGNCSAKPWPKPLQNNDFFNKMTIDVCNEETLNYCQLKKEPFQISKIIGNAQNCQFFCSNIYTTPLRNCQFFIYDQKHDICKLFDFDMMEYDERCMIKGGPPELPDPKCEKGCSVS